MFSQIKWLSTLLMVNIVHGIDIYSAMFDDSTTVKENAVEVPYFASVGDCGAAIISNKWMLVPAHCVENPEKPKQVLVGGKDGYKIKIKNITIYEEYSPGYRFNDIALVETQRPLKFSDTIKAIPLSQSKLMRSTPGVVIGKGVETFKPTEAVMKEDILTCDTINCVTHYFRNSYTSIMYEKSHICVAQCAYMYSVCSDIGGLLVINDTLTGLGSFPFGPCPYNRHSLFTDVSFYISWIKKITGLDL